jgi:hypothetical protein
MPPLRNPAAHAAILQRLGRLHEPKSPPPHAGSLRLSPLPLYILPSAVSRLAQKGTRREQMTRWCSIANRLQGNNRPTSSLSPKSGGAGSARASSTFEKANPCCRGPKVSRLPAATWARHWAREVALLRGLSLARRAHGLKLLEVRDIPADVTTDARIRNRQEHEFFRLSACGAPESDLIDGAALAENERASSMPGCRSGTSGPPRVPFWQPLGS